jgi:transposase
MGKSRRVFTREFKLAAVKEVESGKPSSFVARQLEVSANTLHRWHREFKNQPTKAFSGHGKRMLAESREAQLERKIGQLTMENDFLKKLLETLEEQQEVDGGVGSSTRRSGKNPKR